MMAAHAQYLTNQQQGCLAQMMTKIQEMVEFVKEDHMSQENIDKLEKQLRGG